ncbi:MAG TPA: hypothetical protein DIU00_11060, partial [Phycisphaerales bacterium]|nr:hypothetical protein [Phycisphaerales bacterium]
MWDNKRLVGIAVVAVLAGFMDATVGAGNARAPSVFEGRLEFHKPLPVGITAGTAEYPELVRIESVCFNKRYGNAWGATARVGWLPVKDSKWRLTIELLDQDGLVLKHSRDEPTVITGKAGPPGQSDMQYTDVDLDSLLDQGRRHAARFRVRLEPSEVHVTDGDINTLDVALVDQKSREPIGNTAVVVSSSYLKDTFRRNKALYVTDSQGRCRITLVRDGLLTIGISAQKQDYCTIVKSWSNYGSSALGRAPIVNLPQSHILEMVRASALGGIVQDTEGNPIEGAEARLEARLTEPSGTMNVNCSVRTDAKGRWRVEGIPGEAERITLRLKHAEYGGNNGDSRRIPGEARANARAFKHAETLDKGLTITGKVLDDNGQPVAEATALLSIRSYSPIYAMTDASGAFRLTCSSDRSAYRETPSIIVEAPGYAPVKQNIDLQPKSEPLEFRLKRGRNIACRVVNVEGQPVAGAWTVVQPLEGNRNYSAWLKDTDDLGRFLIPNVPENDVKLTVGKEGYFTIRNHVVAASEGGIVVTMKRALHVHGAVTDAETDESIPNFEIAAAYVTGGRMRTSRPAAFAEGTYEVSFDEASSETRQLRVTAVGYEPVISDQINIDEGERKMDFKLTRSISFNDATAGRPREQVSPTGPRRITGIVRDEQGKPVPDAIVITCPRRGAETVTDAKGVFTLRLMRTGSMGSMLREQTTYLLVRQKERNLAVAMVLDLSANTVNVKLTGGAILSGKVVDVEGKGIPSAELSLTFWMPSIGYRNNEVTEIDESGNYEIRAVPPGHRYSVNASADGYGGRYVQVDTGDAENKRMQVEPLVLSVASMSASGVVVDDLDQPISGIRIYAYGNGQPSRETFTDSEGRFTIENVCPGPLNIQANSQERAPRRLHGRAQAEGGAANIKIVVYELDERGRRVPTQPPSLMGKPLPDLEELGIDALPGGRILVCFWDMQQRPSR